MTATVTALAQWFHKKNVGCCFLCRGATERLGEDTELDMAMYGEN